MDYSIYPLEGELIFRATTVTNSSFNVIFLMASDTGGHNDNIWSPLPPNWSQDMDVGSFEIEAPTYLLNFPVPKQVLGIGGSLVFGQGGMTILAKDGPHWTSGLVVSLGWQHGYLSRVGDPSIPLISEDVFSAHLV